MNYVFARSTAKKVYTKCSIHVPQFVGRIISTQEISAVLKTARIFLYTEYKGKTVKQEKKEIIKQLDVPLLSFSALFSMLMQKWHDILLNAKSYFKAAFVLA